MKKIFYSLIATISISVTVSLFFPASSTERNNTIADEDFRIIAKFKNDAFKNNALILRNDQVQSTKLQNVFKHFQVNEIKSIFKNRYDSNGNYKNSGNNKLGKDLNCWKEILMANKYLANDLIKVLKSEESIIEVYKEYPIYLKPCLIPNDSNFPYQWHINGYIPNADIDVIQAWDINTGRNDVVIAVCDGGVDYNHPDLDPGDRSRIIQGYDVDDGDNDPMDDLPEENPEGFAGHGTKIAGVIGAITNNNNQVSGIMWNCKIMPVKMVKDGRLDIFGIENSETAYTSDVADAIDYAVNNGAHVINLSYGFPDMGWPINDIIFRAPLLYESINNAYENNVVIVVSMGNDYKDGNPTQYPAAFAHEVIAVGASNDLNARASFSSTGAHINVSAPGTAIYTTARGGTTAVTQGTSLSAPIVSAVSGLIISQGMDRNFNLTNDDVRHILEITADDIESPGFDYETGHGKINANSALMMLDEPNDLIHGTSYGGTITSTTNLNRWITIGNRWGIAPGTYLNVDQKEVTKHIEFDVPFCSPPEVWLKERECKSMSFANPNDSFPWASISNITETGFDVRYSIYYVRYNILGQSVNTWVPSSLANSKIAYTAVGEINQAGYAEPINGSSLLCSSGSSYTVSNLPQGTTILWNQSHNITRVSSQGSNPCTFQANGNGDGWIEATISGNCGDFTLPRKELCVGPPLVYVTDVIFSNWEGEPYLCTTHTDNSFEAPQGDYDYLEVKLTDINETQIIDQFYCYSNTGSLDYSNLSPDYYLFWIRGHNSCGWGEWLATEIEFANCSSGGGDERMFMFYPNPTDEHLNISVSDDVVDEIKSKKSGKYEVLLYDKNQKILYKNKSDKKELKINLQPLEEGMYFLHFKYKGKLVQEKVVIKK